MRTKPASSMQKTYDECYLICSTAVYFEGQVSYDNIPILFSDLDNQLHDMDQLIYL